MRQLLATPRMPIRSVHVEKMVQSLLTCIMCDHRPAAAQHSSEPAMLDAEGIRTCQLYMWIRKNCLNTTRTEHAYTNTGVAAIPLSCNMNVAIVNI